MKKNLQHKIERDIKQSGLSRSEQHKALEANEQVETDNTKGLVRLENYLGSDLNLTDWTLTSLLDDLLMCQFADCNEDNTEIMREGIFVPANVVQSAWRVAKVIIAGPRCKTKVGEHVIFPSNFGLKCAKMNGLKNIVFLNEERIFGRAMPNTK
jgi:hypothetical protein